MKALEITEHAESDLVDSALYIARDNLSASERFVNQVKERYQLLAESPGIGRLREDLGKNLRCLPFKTYLIFYLELPDRVRIVRFLSGFRDLPTLFE